MICLSPDQPPHHAMCQQPQQGDGPCSWPQGRTPQETPWAWAEPGEPLQGGTGALEKLKGKLMTTKGFILSHAAHTPEAQTHGWPLPGHSPALCPRLCCASALARGEGGTPTLLGTPRGLVPWIRQGQLWIGEHPSWGWEVALTWGQVQLVEHLEFVRQVSVVHPACGGWLGWGSLMRGPPSPHGPSFPPPPPSRFSWALPHS